MATLTLAQLLTTQDAQAIYETLLGVYASYGFPVTAWQDGETEKTRLLAIATALADISGNYIPQFTAGTFVDFSTGTWLQLKAQEDYNLPFNPATATVGQITITQTSAVASSQTITPGKMIAVFVSGRRYFLTGFMVAGVFTATPQTLAYGSPLIGVFAAENPGSIYNDPSSSAITAATPLPGVTLTNPAGNYSTVVHTGAGTGTLTLTGTPVGTHQILVTIDSTGASGSATWDYSVDGGPAVSAGAAASLSNVGGTGVNIALTNGGSGTSFVENDTYLFNVPGTWITSPGSDVESDTALQTRCRNRWPSLSSIPTQGYYQLLATSVPAVGSQVVQVIVQPDSVVPNKVKIVVAGPAGPLPGGTISTIQSYITPRAIGGDNAVVVSPSTQALTFAGTITIAVNQLTPASNAITTAMNDYVASIPINGTVLLSEIIALIKAIPGVVDVNVPSITINGSAANLPLGSSTTFVMPAYPPTLNFTIVTQ